MAKNVLILGAGFSHEAGIPLLSGFMETMLDIAVRERANGKKIQPQDLALLKSAVAIRGELDGYHGRAVFDDRNIEDILSILAFNVLGGAKKEKQKLETVTRAIAKTIEVTCELAHPILHDGSRSALSDEPSMYRSFWLGLFDWVTAGNSMPDIITFNYDLVLELSLLQTLNNTIYDGTSRSLPFSNFEVKYHHFVELDQAFQIRAADYGRRQSKQGTKTESVGISNARKFVPINILKLHGSLNFPKKRPAECTNNFAHPVEDPQILPPISNKLSEKSVERIWRKALLSLRDAKNVVFVGYSLPQTDMYMQYFLKAAFGPNKDLDKVIVFDPLLAVASNEAEAMRSRYESCFSEQFRKRIVFNPPEREGWGPGKASHFVDILSVRPNRVFF